MIAWFKRLTNWIARIFVWIGEAKQTWVALFTIPLVFFIWWFALSGWELRIRFTGMSLELLGLSTVALGIRETGKRFSQPGLVEIARKWFGSFPKFRRDVRNVTGTGHLNLGGQASVSGRGFVSLPTTASLEERVAFLETGLGRSFDLIHETQQRITKESHKFSSALDTARRDLESGDDKNAKLIQEAMAGGLYLEATGVLWLFFGILFATVSNEIVTASSYISNFLYGVK